MTLKVIGSGFGRTGTMSLKLALEQLGVGPCYHMVEVFQKPEAPQMWVDAANGKPDWPGIFAGYNSTVDWPNATFYAELAQAYPAAKVVHTERDSDDWYRSTQATIFAKPPPVEPEEADTPFARMFREVIMRLFDGDLRTRDHVIGVYERHNAQVRATIPTERLLVFHVSDGWAPLCSFLGVATPEGPIPKVNSTEEFIARRLGPST